MRDVSINRKIAELRGWRVEYATMSDDPHRYGLITPDGASTWYKSEDDAWAEAPDYEHDLNAAIELFWELDSPELSRMALAHFQEHERHEVYYEKSSQALATAICEAWLAMKAASIETEAK